MALASILPITAAAGILIIVQAQAGAGDPLESISFGVLAIYAVVHYFLFVSAVATIGTRHRHTRANDPGTYGSQLEEVRSQSPSTSTSHALYDDLEDLVLGTGQAAKTRRMAHVVRRFGVINLVAAALMLPAAVQVIAMGLPYYGYEWTRALAVLGLMAVGVFLFFAGRAFAADLYEEADDLSSDAERRIQDPAKPVALPMVAPGEGPWYTAATAPVRKP